MLHRCGMLIIEEAQESNIAVNPFGEDFVRFFLRVLNYGVPTVLVGNPQAFEEHIDRHSQTKRRLSFYGSFELNAIDTFTSKTWVEDVMPLMWDWNVFEKPDEHFEGRDEYIWRLTGGIHEMVTRLRRETLLAAIEDGKDQVSRVHIDRAYRSPAMRLMHDLILGYRDRNLTVLGRFPDQPVDYLRQKWTAGRGSDAQPTGLPPAVASPDSEASPASGGPSIAANETEPRNKRPPKRRAIAPTGSTGLVHSGGAPIGATVGDDSVDRRSAEFASALRLKSAE
jgi:hypothetical protein